jgi:hypothetical protein
VLVVNNETKKRIGRPPVPASERKNRTIPFRCRDVLYEALVSHAEANGRTLSQEIEYRIMKGFESRPEPPDVQLIRLVAQEVLKSAAPTIDTDLIRTIARGVLAEIQPGLASRLKP